MTGLVILTFVPFLVAIGFLIRMRGEKKARLAAEQHVAMLQHQLDAQLRGRREWNAALAHELRSPLAAILGYGELLEDGAFGPIDHRAADALQRIRFATQLATRLVDGIDRIALDEHDLAEAPVSVSARALMTDAVDALHFDAEARNTTIRIDDGDTAFTTRPTDAARALTLALGAAIKASPGAALVMRVTTAPAIAIAGTRLHAQRDDPQSAPEGSALTGPGFRLLLARHAARLAGGVLLLEPQADHVALVLRLPAAAAPIDAAEHLP